MTDTLLALLLTIADPNPLTLENEARIALENRIVYAQEHYSAFGKLDDRGLLFIRQGTPDDIVRSFVPREDLGKGQERGKPEEYRVEGEVWWYGDKSYTFQEGKSGQMELLRTPNQLISYVTEVQQAPLRYEYDYPKDSLSCDYVISYYSVPWDQNQVEMQIQLVAESSCLWRVAFQDKAGKIILVDSTPSNPASYYLQKSSWVEENGVSVLAVGYKYTIWLEATSADGKRGKLLKFPIEFQ